MTAPNTIQEVIAAAEAADATDVPMGEEAPMGDTVECQVCGTHIDVESGEPADNGELQEMPVVPAGPDPEADLDVIPMVPM